MPNKVVTSHIGWRRQWQPTPVLSPGKSHGRRSLVGRSPWGHEESDTTERLHFHFSLSCVGEGNGNPLQCSCLENPRDEGAWWAAWGCRVGHNWSDLAAAAEGIFLYILNREFMFKVTIKQDLLLINMPEIVWKKIDTAFKGSMILFLLWQLNSSTLF